MRRIFNSLSRRIAPLVSKLTGNSPFCPWTACFSLLDPRIRWTRPVMQITQIAKDDNQILLSFAGNHFWFPADTIPTQELWNEYLAVFWDSPSNFHYYFHSFSSLKPGDVVIDCGACEGFFVAKALQGGAARVFAIEPNPIMVRCLEKTFEKEVLNKRVIIVPYALGSSEKIISFYCDPKNPFSGKVGEIGVSIKQVTLDNFCISTSLQKIDFIKMDLEGLESRALLGGIRIIRNSSPKLSITTYHGALDFYRVLGIIKRLGYRKIKSSGVCLRNGSEAYRPYIIHAAK